MNDKAKFMPLAVVDGRTYALTGRDWLMVFALAGFQWAIDDLSKLEERSDDERRSE